MSWVRSRIADLEASSGTFSDRTTTSSSRSSPAASARNTIIPAYHRERIQLQPSIESVGTSADEDDQTAQDLLDADSQQRSPSSSTLLDVKPVAAVTTDKDETITSLAGGYYSKPRKQQVARISDAEAARRRSAAAAAKTQQQQAETKRMARKITQLEATLAASEGRIAHLVSSSARAAENASRLRQETEAAAATKEHYAHRVCQLEDTLVQAEKRASWLQGELEVVWACGTQRVAELEYDLELTRRQQLATGGEGNQLTETGFVENESTTEQGSTDTSGGSSLSVESPRDGSRRHGMMLEPRDGLDKMMNDTQQALSSLRTKFYRAMGEKERLQARCDHLEEKLLENANSSSTATTLSNSSSGDNTDDTNTSTSEDSSNHRNAPRSHQLTTSETSETTKPSSHRNRGNEREKINRGGGGARRSRSSRGSSRSNRSSTSNGTVASSTSSSATVAVKAAPVTTVGGMFYSWRSSPPVGPRLSARDDE